MDLLKFCASNTDPRHYMSQPMREGADVVATNGHIMIVMPGMAGEFQPIPDNLRGKAQQFDAVARSERMPLDIIHLPDRKECPICGGAGHHFEVVCPDCDGEGSFKHGLHWYECKECAGNGHCTADASDEDAKKTDCYRCDGSGEAYQAVYISDHLFQRRYLALIKSLPDAALEIGEPLTVSKFTFTGGYGFLMPCRP